MWYRYISAWVALILLPITAWFCVNCEQADRYIAGMVRGAEGAEWDMKKAEQEGNSEAQNIEGMALNGVSWDEEESGLQRGGWEEKGARMRPAALEEAFYFSSEQTGPADPAPGVPVTARGDTEEAAYAEEGGYEPGYSAVYGSGYHLEYGTARAELSGEDYETLLKIVEAEAGTEDGMGKLLVADVVLNRVESESFPDSVKQVVYQQADGHAQFSPVADGSIERVKVSEETEAAVQRALLGEDASKGALYFAAREAADPESMKWFDENLTPLFSYGGHEFFR